MESPAKAKTIGKYLGKEYTVKACMGHLRDLPKSKLGVDPEQDFEPVYQPIKGKEDVISDLKKAAKAAGEKSIDLLPVKDITAVTGYIRGGCSPVGMKKQYPTIFHQTALEFETIYVSAGKIGAQVEVEPRALLGLLRAETADIII